MHWILWILFIIWGIVGLWVILVWALDNGSDCDIGDDDEDDDDYDEFKLV